MVLRISVVLRTIMTFASKIKVTVEAEVELVIRRSVNPTSLFRERLPSRCLMIFVPLLPSTSFPLANLWV